MEIIFIIIAVAVGVALAPIVLPVLAVLSPLLAIVWLLRRPGAADFIAQLVRGLLIAFACTAVLVGAVILVLMSR